MNAGVYVVVSNNYPWMEIIAIEMEIIAIEDEEISVSWVVGLAFSRSWEGRIAVSRPDDREMNVLRSIFS